MNIDQVHVPHRLPEETLRYYHARQALSKRLAKSTKVFHDSYRQGTYFKQGTLSPQRPGATKRRFKNREEAAK